MCVTQTHLSISHPPPDTRSNILSAMSFFVHRELELRQCYLLRSMGGCSVIFALELFHSHFHTPCTQQHLTIGWCVVISFAAYDLCKCNLGASRYRWLHRTDRRRQPILCTNGTGKVHCLRQLLEPLQICFSSHKTIFLLFCTGRIRGF